MTNEYPQVSAAPIRDGRHDFDFLIGSWRVENQRRKDPLDAMSPWDQFVSGSQARSILGGRGIVETYLAPAFPGRGSYEGMALALHESDVDVWRIWWASTAQPGYLDTPVVGRFAAGHGRFECEDVLDGRRITVRHDWTNQSVASARWEQAFSFDGGMSWDTNWTMQFTREDR
jgi:hypothetical protein